MKKTLTITFFLASFFAMSSALAHDPSLHSEKVESPKCEAMNDMDHSKVDTNDPVMMAMMKKCMSEKSDESTQIEETIKSPVDDNEKKEADQHGSGLNH